MLDLKQYKSKHYVHIDNSVAIKKAEKYVTNPKWIAQHSFLPFLHQVNSFDKLSKLSKPYSELTVDERKKYKRHLILRSKSYGVKQKDRNIMMAGHIDSFIYHYYADQLNKKYNEWSVMHGIDSCAIAYRDNKPHQSNITFAAEIINQIQLMQSGYILVGDFKEFFDNINHRILKQRILKVLQEEKLSDDWYNVYRSITKYGYYEKLLLSELFGTDKDLKKRHKYTYFNNFNDFKIFKKYVKPEYNKTNYGIPQGSAISAVMANVYATEFDVELNERIKKLNGIYRRYSDDLIIILPGQVLKKQFDELLSSFEQLVREYKLSIQMDKTKKYLIKNHHLIDLDRNKSASLDYLGFIYDGQNVTMRGKSPYKLYRKAYALIAKAKATKVKSQKTDRPLSKIPYRRSIYKYFTDAGVNQGRYGNFITYARRSQSIFDKISPKTDNHMMKQIRHRKEKMERRMGIKLNIHF